MVGRLIMCLTAISAVASQAPAQTSAQAPTPSKHIAKILSKGDGRSDQTAYRVGSVHEEYEVIAALGLTSEGQSLVVRKKPYDVLDAKDPRTGATHQVWFDISSFYPEF
jgi:hypothetical protein